eukprot:Gb_10007 [translate_table: standard]
MKERRISNNGCQKVVLTPCFYSPKSSSHSKSSWKILESLSSALSSRYFIFVLNDMDEWDQDPESFHHELDMIQWTEKLRPCAEALYLTLFENHRQVLAPLVVDILKEAMAGCPAAEVEITPGMLFKEAAYSAAGITHYELSNYLSFKAWCKFFSFSSLISLKP